MAEEMKRVEIGFGGGQVMSVRLDDQALEDLREAARQAAAKGWYDLETEDGAVSLDLRRWCSSASPAPRTRSASPAREEAAPALGAARGGRQRRCGGARTPRRAPTASASGSRRRTR